MSASDTELRAAVVDALGTVVDPCGLYNGSLMTIEDLGMYRGITVLPGEVQIEVFLDDPSCAFAGQIMIEIKQAVAPRVEGREVRMSLVVDDYWDEDRMSEVGRRKLETARAARRKMLPLRVASSTTR